MDHHDFSPSRLEQFRLCPGSYYMQQGLPEEESEWAAEGTRLHQAVATHNLDGLNDEQATAVQKCIDLVDHLVEPGDVASFEETLHIKDKDGTLLTYGVADVVIFNRVTRKLIVVDWKFGYNPVKDVSNNIQVATYAAGAIQKYGVSSCGTIVFQPRIHLKSEYTYTNEEAIVANIRSTTGVHHCTRITPKGQVYFYEKIKTQYDAQGRWW